MIIVMTVMMEKTMTIDDDEDDDDEDEDKKVHPSTAWESSTSSPHSVATSG